MGRRVVINVDTLLLVIRLPPPRTTRKQAYTGERQQKHGIGREVRIGRSHLGRRHPCYGEPGAKRVVVVDAVPADAAAARPIGVLDFPNRRRSVVDGLPEHQGRPTLWRLGVVGLSGMGIFNFVVIVDTARKLLKFCIRTPMPIENARVAKDS